MNMNMITKGYQDVPMTRRRAQLLEEYAGKLADMLEAAPNDKDLAEWVQAKIDRAAAAIQSAYHYLDQEDESELEKARVLKYDYRRPSKTRFNKKTGKREWDYFYAKKHGARVTRGAFEAGAAFRMTFKGRKGHFHIHHVKGDQVFITHDSRPDMEPIPVQADELRALLERQHKREVDQHLKRKTRKVEEIKRRAHRGGLGLALHRLRQAAAQAGVSLPEQYQRKPKKTRAPVAETARETETAPQAGAGEVSFQGVYQRFLEERAELPKPRKGRRDTRGIDALRALSDQELKALNEGYKNEESKLEQIKAKSRPLFEAYSKEDLELGAEIEEKSRAYRRMRVGEREARRQARAEIGALKRRREESNNAWGDLNAQRKQEIENEIHALIKPATNLGISGDSIGREIARRLDERAQAIIEEATTPRDQLTSAAQQIIADANQEHEERHEEHQEITRFELGEHVHTKTGAKLFTAKQTERVDRDEYSRRVEIAKKYRGRYERRYVRGFVFQNADDARAFALEVEGATQEAPETSAETVTPHEDHPSADNFETMPEVESAEDRTRGDLKSKQQALDLLRRSEQEDELKGRRRAKGAGTADKALMRAVREILKRPDPTQDLDERDRQRLRDSLFSLEEAQRPNKYMNAQRSKEKRQRARATIKEILDQQVRMISEALSPTPIPQTPAPEPTTPSTRPASAYYGRATKKLVDQALSTEPTGFDPKRSGIDLPTKGDLREMLSQEQRLERAKEDLRQVGVKYFPSSPADPRSDIMFALSGYLNGPYVELEQERIREMERGLKIALRDSKGEELEQVKDETARFWREWGGEYKRLQRELVTERTQGEALRNIRPLIPDYVLTPEINQLLDQMERELDQKPVSGKEVSEWISTRDTNEATRDRQPTTPREQLTETALEPKLNLKQIRAREALKRAQGALTRIKAGNRSDKLTATGRRARASINADKELIEAIERIIERDYREMERPLPSDINQRTSQQDNFAKLRGALNGFKSSQTLTRGSWTDDHESLKKKRIKSRSEIEDAIKNLEARSREELQTQTQTNIEDLPPKGQRTAEDAKRFFGEPSKNEAIKRVTYERDGHIVTGPASGRGKGKFRYDLSLPRERFRDEPLLATAQSSNEIGTYDTLDEALTAAINQYEPSDQIIDRMIESAKEERERTAQRMGVTPREQLTETAREVTQGADNFATMPEVEAPAREQLIETAEQATAPSSPLDIDQANAQDTLTENRTRAPESKAADKALIESARELAKTSERGEEIKSALVDLMNAQQLKRYKRATGDTRARAEDMIEKRREARERLRAATSGEVINNFETMPEVEAQPKKRSGPDISRYKRALSLAKKAERLDKLKNNRRSKASREADQALISIAQEILEKDLGDVEVRTIYRKPSTMWTREESLKVAIGAMAGELKTRQRALGGRGGAEQAQELRVDAREKLIDAIQEHVDRFLPDEVIDARLDRDLARDARETAKQEAREAQEARQYQQKTFTPEIQSAIDNLRHPYQKTRVDSFESHFKTRKDGGVFRATLAPKDIAVKITSSLPREINQFIAGKSKSTLSSEIAAVIEQGLEDRKTPAELKDAIGETVTAYAEDNAVIDKESISSSKAIIELDRNITALTGTGLFDGDSSRREERFRRLPFIGLERLKNDMGDINERIKASVSMRHVFTRRLSERMEKYEVGLPNRVRFNSSGPEVITAVYAEAYPTVGDIRENISEIRDELRAMITDGLNGVTNGVANPEVIFNRIKSGYEKATEQKNKDREDHLDRAKKLAQYTDDPQAHLSEVQERERKSAQEISEQLETNREFADAYSHEAAKIIEDATENTKGELIENLLESRSSYQLKAPIEGKANRKLMARIFNEVFEQVTREIRDEPIERGEKHPRNIADTVKKPSKTPTQFRGDIERADEEKMARKLAEREARRARRVQKSARPLITYRAQLTQTVERLTAA